MCRVRQAQPVEKDIRNEVAPSLRWMHVAGHQQPMQKAIGIASVNVVSIKVAPAKCLGIASDDLILLNRPVIVINLCWAHPHENDVRICQPALRILLKGRQAGLQQFGTVSEMAKN